MERAEVVEILTRLESKYSVEQWNIKGVNCWPIIRVILFFHWFKSTNTRGSDKVKRFSVWAKGILLLKSLWFWITIKETDVLTVGNSKQHEERNGQAQNRFYFIVKKIAHSLQKSYLYICTDSPNSITQISAPFADYNMVKAWPLVKQKFLKKKKFNVSFNNFDELVNEFFAKCHIPAEAPHVTQYSKTYIAELFTITYPILKKFIAKTNPKLIIQTTYYTPIGYGFNILGFQKNIPTIDIQHGGQGPLHISYGSFTKIPEKGYALLPKYFWCWDEQSTTSITNWAESNDYHSAIALGNPWVQYIMSEEDKELEQKLSSKKRILVTMQFDTLDDYMIETIKVTCKEYDWWIRMHPTLKDSRKNIANQLTQIGLLQEVELELANNQNLIEILKHTDIHISKFSGAIIEASQLGVSSIITDEIGLASFGNIIEQGRAISCTEKNEESLISAISSLNVMPKLEPQLTSNNRIQVFISKFFISE